MAGDGGWGMVVLMMAAAAGVSFASIYFPQLSKEVVIGIDLGTTYSVVAVCIGGQVQIIQDSETGSGLLPSYVSYLGKSVLVGQAAKDLSVKHPKETVFDVKRIIGRRFADPVVQGEIENFPFRVIPSPHKVPLPVIAIGDLRIYPTNVSGAILHKLKDELEYFFWWRRWLGWKIRTATISVPANFNAEQQFATLEAAREAGFSNVQLITEPAAAALAFRLHQRGGVRHVLVFDFGGGTLDVALLVLDQQTFAVMTTSGDPHLGGEDVDRCLVKHLLSLLEQQAKRKLAPDSAEALGPLRRYAELLKIELSDAESVELNYTGLHGTITRQKLEEQCDDLFQRAMLPVKEVMKNAGMGTEDVGDVVLVGGSSRIPKIRELLSAVFDGARLNTAVDPDEAVARGAALTRTCK